MDRRRFLLTSLAGVLATPLNAGAQLPGNVRRIGFVSASSPESSREAMEEFRRGIRERGYVEGQNIHIEYRWAEGKSTRLPDLVLELISLRVELIVAVASPAARAVHQATRTIPIVIVGVGNPVALGLATSLARPGGNVTGLTSSGLDLNAKQLELLREAVPDMKRLAVMWTPTNPLHQATVRDLEELTRSRGIQIQSLKVASPDEIEEGFRTAAPAARGLYGSSAIRCSSSTARGSPESPLMRGCRRRSLGADMSKPVVSSPMLRTTIACTGRRAHTSTRS